jgi:hypothetical protein
MNTRQWILALVAVAPACDCESSSYVATSATESDASDGTTSTSGASGMLAGSSSAADESTGAPFDASRWLGRYHYEYPYAEWGDPLYTSMLVNFEIFEDGTATLLYDECSTDLLTLIHYEWKPDEEPGWIELHPGAGETYLRFLVDQPYETLRVQLIEPCRKLELELDMKPSLDLYPGASCWLHRCGHGLNLVVDYCEGEEPPPCP